jgi:hypothetical protein
MGIRQGQALIPLYARETWTDHNAHDPGITLMELFAWIAEMDIYQINRVPDRHKRKFLALVGTAAAGAYGPLLQTQRRCRTVGATGRNRIRGQRSFRPRRCF